MTGRTKRLLRVVYLAHLLLLIMREQEHHLDPYAPSICRHSGPGKVIGCTSL